MKDNGKLQHTKQESQGSNIFFCVGINHINKTGTDWVAIFPMRKAL